MSARSFIQQQEGAHEIPVTCGYMEQTHRKAEKYGTSMVHEIHHFPYASLPV